MKLHEVKLNYPDLKNYTIINSREEDVLSKLSKINIFVGTNNSGKSRFIRGISKIPKYQFTPQDFDYDKASKFCTDCIDAIEAIMKKYGMVVLGDIRKTLIPSIQPATFFTPKENFIYRLNDLFDYILNPKLQHLSHSYGNVNNCDVELKAFVGQEKPTLDELLKSLKAKETEGYKKIYIPTLRGLRPTRQGLHENEFRNRTSIDYYENTAGTDKYNDNEIFTGLELFEEIKRKLLGNLAERKLAREFEEYLSENFFDNKPIALIPGHADDVLTVKIGDEEEKKIYDLGDGIQSLIILNYPIFEFVRKNPKKTLLVFVEEPELYIHPGLQRKLLERWDKSDYKNVQFFITTHSHHFLDMTIDFSNISIYRVSLDRDHDTSSENSFFVENLSSGNKSLLETLGVRNSSVFLANSTIWVEGISDRIYVRKYLELYEEKLKQSSEGTIPLKEDIDYSFVEYGGGNLPHWSFEDGASTDNTMRVKSIVSKIFLIADRDDTNTKPESEKALRLQKIRTVLGGNNIFVPNAREIESIISWNILRKTIEARGDVIKSSIREDAILRNLPEEHLGEYIETHLIEGSPKKKYKASTSKTLTNKPEFAKEICSQIENYDELSDEAKRLTESLYNFIIKQTRD